MHDSSVVFCVLLCSLLSVGSRESHGFGNGINNEARFGGGGGGGGSVGDGGRGARFAAEQRVVFASPPAAAVVASASHRSDLYSNECALAGKSLLLARRGF